MERTNYVAKAKTLMKKAVRNSALVIVPLAAAVAASASSVVPTLPTSSFSCGLASGGVNCSASTGVAALPGAGINGVEFFTNGPLVLVASGGFSGLYFQDFGMSTHATDFTGVQLPSSIPVFADFTLAATGGATVTNWSLTLSFMGRYSGSANFSGSTAGPFSGSDTITLSFDSNTAEQWVSSYMFVEGSLGSSAGQVTIDVPKNGSSDFGASAAAVPEPGTTGLVVAGLALAGFLRRRK